MRYMKVLWKGDEGERVGGSGIRDAAARSHLGRHDRFRRIHRTKDAGKRGSIRGCGVWSYGGQSAGHYRDAECCCCRIAKFKWLIGDGDRDLDLPGDWSTGYRDNKLQRIRPTRPICQSRDPGNGACTRTARRLRIYFFVGYGERAIHVSSALDAVMSGFQRGVYRNEDGGAVLEVALAMPLLMLTLMGVLQFGVVLFGYCSASFAARNAVRFASMHSNSSLSPATTATVQAYITPYLWMGAKASAPTVTPSWTGGNVVGNTVAVTVSETYNVVLPFSGKKQVTIAAVASRLIVR